MSAQTALRTAAGSWFAIAILGQIIFASYVAIFYGRAVLAGDLSRWNKVMPHGYVPGDLTGNLMVGLHLFWAFLILTTGGIQLIPTIRRRAPAVHRYSGRVYMVAALVTSLAGAVMVWTRGTVGGMLQHVSITVNAVLIVACTVMAWRYARARQFADHRRWALRLFLVASGVWFFRVFLMLWLVIHRAPVGFDPKTFQGPFLSFLAIGQYAIPLLILELYFRAERSSRPALRWSMAGALGVLTLATMVGVGAATMGMWLRRL